MAIIPTESNQHPNANKSRLFAAIIVAFFIIFNALAYFVHPALHLFENDSFLTVDAIALALTIVFGVINVENTFETNDNWKTYGGVITILYTVLSFTLFISKGA